MLLLYIIYDFNTKVINTNEYTLSKFILLIDNKACVYIPLSIYVLYTETVNIKQ